MWRFLMICLLAVFVPMGHGLAEEEVNPEDAFFDAIFNDDGELVEITRDFYYENLGALHVDIYERRFGCIQTDHKAEYSDPPSYSLVENMLSISHGPHRIFFSDDKRYLLVAGCQYRACALKGLDIIDIIGKDFAFVAITPGSGLLTPENSMLKNIDGSEVLRGDSFELFLSNQSSERFKYQAAVLAIDWTIDEYGIRYKEELKPLEFVYVDCR